MPIEGKFYDSGELQKLLGITRQAISQLAIRQNWTTLDARYCAEDVEDYLRSKNIRPKTLPVRTYANPDGATWAELEAEHDAAQAAGVTFREASEL